MPRPQYRNPKRKACAEMLVAALLCEVNQGAFSSSGEKVRLRTQDYGIFVRGTPAALLDLMEFYSEQPDFPAKKGSVALFRQLGSVKVRREGLRDTLTDMGRERLGFTDEEKRSPRSSPIREFRLRLHYAPTEVRDNLRWLFGANGEWDRRAQEQSRVRGKEGVHPLVRETQQKLLEYLYEAIKLFPSDLSEFTPSHGESIAPYVQIMASALDQDGVLDEMIGPMLMLNLGKFYLATNELDLAFPRFEACVQSGGVTGANGCHYLGVWYTRREDYSRAEYYYLQALQGRGAIRRDNRHPDLGATHHCLALLYIYQGQYALATNHLQTALDIWQDRPFSLARGLQLQGELCLRSQDLSGAKDYFIRALELAGERQEHNAIAIAECLRGLAKINAKQRHYQAARQLWQEALDLASRFRYQEHPLYPLLMADLAAVHGFLGDSSTAQQLYKTALCKAGNIYGEQHQVAIAICQDYHHLFPKP
ncbi:tetratricopeptide repeat protein [Roseofilum sp. BLCC_M154]|uniref:Tetratricopeptide repeat protein n=1 Tax=Roseofilum acuticapitatum BLCC-M154 TaxID=3022444 RepID=A0ABT7ASV8_9CYAN|nr:tetratricopeptide repeat protein [Roseofilum acuticapitatum]MDJ1169997.1 tetratricopeptide repeat protein [Roseofilum acuticapitatum BLCC-M154]